MSDKLNAYDIQRELLSIEERLTLTRQSFSGYAAGDETPEVKKFDAAIKVIRVLQVQMRRFFKP